jgi:adenosylcobyric acid synthase
MLGREVRDRDHIESSLEVAPGLSLLAVETDLEGEKATHLIAGEASPAAGLLDGDGPVPLRGYEIHMGRTEAPGRAPLHLSTRSGAPCDVRDGALSAGGWVLGTYVHGLLESDALRARILANLARRKGVPFEPGPPLSRDVEYDRLASVLRESFDLPALKRIAGL